MNPSGHPSVFVLNLSVQLAVFLFKRLFIGARYRYTGYNDDDRSTITRRVMYFGSLPALHITRHLASHQKLSCLAKDLFNLVTPHCNIDFIKEIGLFRRIWVTYRIVLYMNCIKSRSHSAFNLSVLLTTFQVYFINRIFHVLSTLWSLQFLGTNSLFVLMCRKIPYKQTNKQTNHTYAVDYEVFDGQIS